MSMKILAVEKENSGTKQEEFAPFLKLETLKIWELYREDIIREIYFNQDHCAVIVLECMDIDEANAILNDLPLVKKGLISFEIMELTPYTGIERLIP